MFSWVPAFMEPEAGERRAVNMLKEFKEFAIRGNVVDMAVGIIVGGAFGTIAKSVVNDVLMPPIGLMLGGVDFTEFFAILKKGTDPGPYETLAEAQAAGAVTINYGMFINSIVTFAIVAFAVFLLVKMIQSNESSWVNASSRGL